MALTDIVLRELYKRAKRGEKVAMKSDGGRLSFEAGRYWRFTFSFAGKKKRLALGVYPDVSLKMARLACDGVRGPWARGVASGKQCKAYKAENVKKVQEDALCAEKVRHAANRASLQARSACLNAAAIRVSLAADSCCAQFLWPPCGVCRTPFACLHGIQAVRQQNDQPLSVPGHLPSFYLPQ